LDRQTLIPLGAAIASLVLAFAAYTWLEGRFRMMENLLEGLDRRMERVERSAAQRWTRSEHAIWAATLARQNPALKVPAVDRSP
jgi:hypothetical protein